ncbi:MAG: four helix bundle protein [Planctomycetes bacterium]|nr:four helix bundle protein [Planctomycetota bacterium]
MAQELEDLRVYSVAREMCARAYRLSADVADTDLRDQIRRAATSVVLNIAEGRGRGSDADFARCIAIARGSNYELTAQLQMAMTLGILGDCAALVAELQQLGRMLSALINRLRMDRRN